MCCRREFVHDCFYFELCFCLVDFIWLYVFHFFSLRDWFTLNSNLLIVFIFRDSWQCVEINDFIVFFMKFKIVFWKEMCKINECVVDGNLYTIVFILNYVSVWLISFDCMYFIFSVWEIDLRWIVIWSLCFYFWRFVTVCWNYCLKP